MPPMTVPYRSADVTLERFGAVVSRHGRSKLAVLRSVAIVVVLSLVGLSALASLASQEPGEGIVAPFVILMIACTAAVALILRALGSRGVHRERRLIRRARGGEVGMLWDDVIELRVSRRDVRRWLRDGCTLLAADGGRLALTASSTESPACARGSRRSACGGSFLVCCGPGRRTRRRVRSLRADRRGDRARRPSLDVEGGWWGHRRGGAHRDRRRDARHRHPAEARRCC